ncbi:hypothetical protein [Hansschlegelia sp.]|uniref:hypothetical protein n=1 Tax=Hansschlegelia sp. TaxID=2041892 RepID=UPI002C405D2E|nr:hypothetical protein [Hansschlegelia sp.]HVI28955.1 hypothetical protein [Hansschlegelia sp.]
MTEPPFSSDDYEAIAAAVMETERGRWFLSEYARRNRAADTAAILAALSELERRFQPAPPHAEPARMAHLLRVISERTNLLRNELRQAGAIKPVGRALRQLKRLERVVALALAEAGPAAGADGAVDAGGSGWPGEAAAPAFVAPLELAAAATHPGAVEDDATFVSVNGHAIDLLAVTADAERFGGIAAENTADFGAIGTSEQRLSDETAAEALTAAFDIADSEPEEEFAESPSARGRLIDLLAVSAAAEPEHGDDQDEAESSRHTPAPRPPSPPRMPAAWMPSLLDSLSEEEKAILFA